MFWVWICILAWPCSLVQCGIWVPWMVNRHCNHQQLSIWFWIYKAMDASLQWNFARSRSGFDLDSASLSRRPPAFQSTHQMAAQATMLYRVFEVVQARLHGTYSRSTLGHMFYSVCVICCTTCSTDLQFTSLCIVHYYKITQLDLNRIMWYVPESQWLVQLYLIIEVLISSAEHQVWSHGLDWLWLWAKMCSWAMAVWRCTCVAEDCASLNPCKVGSVNSPGSNLQEFTGKWKVSEGDVEAKTRALRVV